MAYSYYAPITIDNTKVSGSSNLTNFPMVVYGTYDGTDGEPDLRSSGNGGNIQDGTNAYDIDFFSDSDLTVSLDFERVSHNVSTGAVQYWVEVPTLKYDEDTVIYMAYGEASPSDQSNSAGTWSGAGYEAVWHMEQVPTTNQVDSTGNGHTFTYQNYAGTWGSANSVAGGIGQGIGWSSNGQGTAYSAENYGNGNYTFSTFFYTNESSLTLYYYFYRVGASQSGWYADWGAGGHPWGFRNEALTNFGGSYTPTTTYYVTGTQASDGTIDFWINGSQLVNNNSNALIDWTGGINLFSKYTNTYIWGGMYDEMRFAKSVLTDDWIVTDHNATYGYASFYSMGSETAVGGGPAPVILPTGYMTTNTKFWGN